MKTRKELEQRFGFTFTEVRLDEVEVQYPAWSGHWKNRMRVTLVNRGETVHVARPGRGGTFKLSYQYIGSFQTPVGYDKVMQWLDVSSMTSSIRRHPLYQECFASAVVSAIHILQRNRRAS